MPLHLLGKKSWNVYNADNIARVRHDEEAAAAAEEAEEQRMQEDDAARRTAILRGETPPPLQVNPQDTVVSAPGIKGQASSSHDWERESRRKKRKLEGEDDTDRDIRLAREDAQQGESAKQRLVCEPRHDVSIVDAKGHISLFEDPDQKPSSKREKRDAAEAERKRTEEDERTGMKFSHAAGYKAGKGDPWYVSNDHNGTEERSLGKNAFGYDDPERKGRDQRRVVSNDPMAMMKAAQSQLKRVERDKSQWEEQRRREEQKLKEQQRKEGDEQHRRRQRHRHSGSNIRLDRRPDRRDNGNDSLDGFSLDAPPMYKQHERLHTHSSSQMQRTDRDYTSRRLRSP